MTGEILLPSSVLIEWMIRTLPYRQEICVNHCHSCDLGQGQRKVIQYISPDLYFLCRKYLRLSSNGFDVISKSRWASEDGRNGDGGDGWDGDYEQKT